MAHKHIVETLIEIHKKILTMSNKIEKESELTFDRQACIDGLNTIIRNLDHLVEDLEKTE